MGGYIYDALAPGEVDRGGPKTPSEGLVLQLSKGGAVLWDHADKHVTHIIDVTAADDGTILAIGTASQTSEPRRRMLVLSKTGNSSPASSPQVRPRKAGSGASRTKRGTSRSRSRSGWAANSWPSAPSSRWQSGVGGSWSVLAPSERIAA